MVKTIWGLFYADNLMRHLSDARASIDPGWKSYLTMMKEMWHNAGLFEGDGENTTPEFLAEAFVRRNDEFKAALPADRLLVWAAKDGWGPLCEFLEVPVPDQPFPEINDSGHFAEWMIGPALQKIRSTARPSHASWRARPAPVTGSRSRGGLRGSPRGRVDPLQFVKHCARIGLRWPTTKHVPFAAPRRSCAASGRCW